MRKFILLWLWAWMPFALCAQQVLNVQHPVSITTTSAYSSMNPSDYTWSDPGNNLQGVTIYVPKATTPYSPTIYLQETNGRLAFSLSYTGKAFHRIELSYDGGPYVKVFEVSSSTNPRSNFGWVTPPSSFMTSASTHSLSVKYMDNTGAIAYRDYGVVVVPDAAGFLRDNATTNSNFYRNTLTYWQSPSATSTPSKVVLLVSGFDAANTTSAEFYYKAGEGMFQELLNFGYRVYVLKFAFNAQDMRRNAAVVHSAVEYVSSLHGNAEIVVAGASMGGVISRYALAKDEEVQNALGSTNYLPVSQYVSLDAPHQGAVLSTDLVQYLYDNDPTNFAINTTAFKQLVRNNPNSSAATVHQSFFNELNGLNGGVGYPTHTTNIGCAFSNPNLPNPESGQQWLYISSTISTGAGSSVRVASLSSSVGGEAALAGSLLPKGTGVSNDIIHNILGVSGMVVTTTTRSGAGPTFIPYFSAMDIGNGASPFCIELFLQDNTYPVVHDKIPTDLGNSLVEVIDGNYLTTVRNHETYNLTKQTTRHILSNLQVFGEMGINGFFPAGLTPGNAGAYPAPGSRLVVSTNACEGVDISIENGGHLQIGDNAANTTGELRIANGSTLRFKSGSMLDVAEGSELIIEDGATLIFEDGAQLDLNGATSNLVIRGKLKIEANATFAFTGDGQLVLDQNVGRFVNGVWTTVFDDYWEFGANASIDIQGNDPSDVILVIKKYAHPRMDNGTKPKSISLSSGVVQIDKDQQFHIGSDLTMNSVSVECSDPTESHGGIRFWNSNATINNCSFKDGNALGALAIYNIGGSKSVVVQYSDFSESEVGLFVTGEGVQVKSCNLTNNDRGAILDYVSRSSVISNSNFVDNTHGLKVTGQAGFSLKLTGNLFENHSGYGVELVAVESAILQRNRIKSNYIGVFGLGSVLDLSGEAYNCFDDNQAGIQLMAEEGYRGGIYLKNGYNRFDLGTHMNGKYITGSFCPNKPMSNYVNGFIDVSYNQMPTISQVGGLPIMPVAIMYKPNCFNGTSTPIHVTFNGHQLTSIAGACGAAGSGTGPNDLTFEERELDLMGPGKVVFGSDFPNGMPLRDAVLEGASFVSRSKDDIRDDALALDYFESVLNQAGQNWTSEELRMFELTYSLAKKAFNNLHQYDAEYIGITNPVDDDKLTFLSTYINSELSIISQSASSGLNTEFSYNLDYAQLHRSGRYYSEAISRLNTASNWATGMELDRANFWKCICETEDQYLSGLISEEDYQVNTQMCVSLYPNASFKNGTIINEGENGYPLFEEGQRMKVMQLYPNPVSDELTILLSHPYNQAMELELSDMSGRVIATKSVQVSGVEVALNVAELSNGVYHLVLKTSENELVINNEQIVIQH